MVANPEKRHNARIHHDCPVTIEDLKVGLIYKAQMLNYSENGLYFEADKLLRPGEGVFIGIENSPLTNASDTYACYRAKIVWRQKLMASSFYYGYGVRYTINYSKVNMQIGDFKEWDDIRRHERKSYSRPIFFVTENRRYGGLTQNISPAGAFIKAHKHLAVGQILTLGIPLKRAGKVKVKGRVVWSNPEGFGLKFLKIEKNSGF